MVPREVEKIDEAIEENNSVKAKIALQDISCPISKMIFYEPCIVNCGHTFEKECVEKIHHSKNNKSTCPCCRTPITTILLNRAVISFVSTALAQNPSLASQQYLPKKKTQKEEIIELIKYGKTEILVALLKETPLLLNEPLNDLQYTALHCAAIQGHAGLCELLIKAGASIESVSQEGKTPLQLAKIKAKCCLFVATIESKMQKGDINAAVKFLLEYRLDTNFFITLLRELKNIYPDHFNTFQNQLVVALSQSSLKNHKLLSMELTKLILQWELAVGNAVKIHKLFFESYKPGLLHGSMGKFKKLPNTPDFAMKVIDRAEKKPQSATAHALREMIIKSISSDIEEKEEEQWVSGRRIMNR